MIVFDHVTKYYETSDGENLALDDMSLHIKKGEFVFVLGHSGAGKSTFLKILSGSLETTNGEIIITPGQRLSVLEQDHFKYDAYPVMDVVIMGNARLYDIMKEKEAIYAKEDFTDEDGIRASELEAEFGIVHDLADGRDGVGRNLYKVHALLLCHGVGLGSGNDTQLGTVGTDETNFLIPDLLIQLMI